MAPETKKIAPKSTDASTEVTTPAEVVRLVATHHSLLWYQFGVLSTKKQPIIKRLINVEMVLEFALTPWNLNAVLALKHLDMRVDALKVILTKECRIHRDDEHANGGALPACIEGRGLQRPQSAGKARKGFHHDSDIGELVPGWKQHTFECFYRISRCLTVNIERPAVG